tara:strand:- start:274 stop:525 length:252 start_codon:yes stop_codon:yes gene_type:complete
MGRTNEMIIADLLEDGNDEAAYRIEALASALNKEIDRAMEKEVRRAYGAGWRNAHDHELGGLPELKFACDVTFREWMEDDERK